MIVLNFDKGQRIPTLGEPMTLLGVNIGSVQSVEERADCFRVVIG